MGLLSSTYSIYAIVLLFMVALIASCESSLPTEEEMEGPPQMDNVSWTVPEKIEIPGLNISKSYSIPLSFYMSSDDSPQLLIRIPQDETLPHKKNKLAHLSFEGESWELVHTIDAAGDFDPIRSVSGLDGETYYFWSGVTPEEEHLWFNDVWHLPELYYCSSSRASCETPVVLASNSSGTGWAYFRSVVRDDRGMIHIVSDMDGVAYHYTIGEAGLIGSTWMDYQSEPYLMNHKGSIHMVSVSWPPIGETSGTGLYHQVFDGTQWLQPTLILYDEQIAISKLAMGADKEGALHVVFYANTTVGDVPIYHTVSVDNGTTWTTPTVINRNMYAQVRPPSFVFDQKNQMHLVFSHAGEVDPAGTGVTINTYYMTFNDGIWSNAVELFPEFNSKSDVLITIEDRGDIHAVVTGFDKNVYHSRLSTMKDGPEASNRK